LTILILARALNNFSAACSFKLFPLE